MNRSIFAVASLVALCACGTESETGRVALRLNGEEGAIGGYPVPGGPAFVDGWTLQFDKVIVGVADFTLATSDGDDAGLTLGAFVADLHQGMPALTTFEDVPAQRWDRTSYRFAVPPADVTNVSGVDEADLAKMRDGGFTFLFAGEAHKGDSTITFEWGFANVVHNSRCVSGIDGTDGLVVRANSSVDAELTVHLDHLFFDSFIDEEPDMHFDPIAAAAGDDGDVTLDELRAQSLSDLRVPGGGPLVDESGAPIVYDPGSFPLTEDTLHDYMLEAGARSMGHFHGEGHCEYSTAQ